MAAGANEEAAEAALMRFRVERTSVGDDIQPCDGAYWQGTHRELLDGTVRRDGQWYIDIPTIEALVAFVRDTPNASRSGLGNEVIVIVGELGGSREVDPTLEIYDDWRE